MLMRFVLLALTLFVVFPPFLLGSEEEFLPWLEVKLTGPDRPDTGKVMFTAKLAGNQYKEVHLEAFGKQFDLSKDQLQKLTGFPLQSLRLTHEAGYEKLGGHTVHVRLKRSIMNAAGQLVEEGVILSVSKGKGLEVSGPKQLATAGN